LISTIEIQSLTIGEGTDYTILNARGFESPGVDIARSPLAGRHGVTIHRTLWRERIIRLEIGVRAPTVSEHATLRKNLLEAFDLPRNGNTTMKFVTTDGKSLQIDVNIANVIDGGFLPGYLTASKMRIELIAGDPSIYTQTQNEETITPPVAGGTALPTAIPFALATSGGSVSVENAGNGISWPTITIYGPAVNAHVRNSTLGIQFNIETTLTAAQYVVVSPQDQTVLLNGVINYIQYFSEDWWWLEPGSNSIQYNSEDNHPDSYVKIQWRSAYAGI